MSSGQKPRTREHFPRMKDRKGRREARRAARADLGLPELMRAMAGFAAAVSQIGAVVREVFEMLGADARALFEMLGAALATPAQQNQDGDKTCIVQKDYEVAI